MYEPPDLPESRIAGRLSDAYGLPVRRLEFLPVGADIHTAVYRVETAQGSAYFLKLRRHFDPVTVLVPRFLSEQGVRQVAAPLRTRDGELWSGGLEGYTAILYPWIDGRSGFEQELTAEQWTTFGAALRGIHTSALPPELCERIPAETFSPQFRRQVTRFQAQVERQSFADPLAARMAALMRSRRGEIRQLVARAGELAGALAAGAPEKVLCHADMHAGNLLLGASGALTIVDWDDCVLAPKERDLMFIGGGVGGTWNRPDEAEWFYRGYGEVEINPTALTYYRCERIVADIAAFCDEILLTTGEGADRERLFGYFASQFSPGAVIDIARRTDPKLAAG